MSVVLETVDEPFEPFEIRRPVQQSSALVYASPHSGTRYTERFLRQSRLDPLTLRKSEDSFVMRFSPQRPTMARPYCAPSSPAHLSIRTGNLMNLIRQCSRNLCQNLQTAVPRVLRQALERLRGLSLMVSRFTTPACQSAMR